MIHDIRLALLCMALLCSVGALGAMGAALLGAPVWAWETPARVLFAVVVGLVVALIVVWRET